MLRVTSPAAALIALPVIIVAGCDGGPSDPPPTESPTVETLAASNITTESALAHGQVTANGAETSWDIEIGATPALGQSCLLNQRGTLDADASETVQCLVDGVPPGVTVYYRVIAENSVGNATGETMSFTTLSTAPTAETLPATGISTDEAVLHGRVSPNGEPTTVAFEVGFTPQLGQLLSSNPLPEDTGTFIFQNTIEIQTAPETTVYYRVVAENALGTAYGETLSFETPASTAAFTSGAPGSDPSIRER